MAVLTWLKADIRRPARHIAVREWPVLAGSSLVIIVIAQISEPARWTALLLLVFAGCLLTALALTRLAIEPLSVLIIVAVGSAVGTSGRLEVSFFMINILTVYAAWHLGSTVRATMLTVLAIATIVTLGLTHPDEFGWSPWVVAEFFTLVLGRVLFAQREAITALQAAREELAGQAVAEERRRIARELHDLAGHSLAAMMLHVTGARHVLRRDLDEADQALKDAEAVGRSGLAQVRTTVTALRTTEHGLDPPLPRSVDLDALVDDYRRAGLSIRTEFDHGAYGIEGPVALAVTRICGEALANVTKHARGNTVHVAVTIDRDEVIRLSVVDSGRVPHAPAIKGGGFGVIGMSERAKSVGGTLVAEPTANGWRVQASLPSATPHLETVTA